MQIFSIGSDQHVLEPSSTVSVRNCAYGEKVDHYSVIVPAKQSVIVHLSEKTTAYGVSGANKAIKLWRIYKLASQLIGSEKKAVITTQDAFYLGLVGYLIAKHHNLGLEIQVHGIEKLSRIRRLIFKFLLKRASVVRANSERTKQRLIQEFDGAPSRIRVVPIHVDITSLGLDEHQMSETERDVRQGVRKKFREQYGSCFNFLTVSRLVPIKNIEMQLSALKQLNANHPNAMLHIVGDGPERTGLEHQVESLGLEAQVIFHGALYGHALGALYLECDAFLLTSHYEGWGMVIVEALHAGIPIIMTDVGCAGELVKNGESGVVLQVDDTDALASAMERYIVEPSYARQLAEEGKRAVTTLPLRETIIQKYLESWEYAASKRL